MMTQLALFTAAFYADPYPAYRALRELNPIHHDSRMGWLVTRYADIQARAHDPRLSRAGYEAKRVAGVPTEAQAIAQPVLAGLAVEMLRTDPPAHTRLRHLVARAFTPRSVELLRPRIQTIVDAMLNEAAIAGGMDLIRDLAYPLPAMVIMELLGVPVEDRDQLKRWTADRIAFLGSITVAADPLAVAQRARDSVTALHAYFRGLLAERRARPTDDLLSALIAVEAEEDGRLSEQELVANAMHLLTAGHETTTNLIGNGFLALLRHPEQWELLRTEPAHIPVAVEELLRYDTPVQFAPRSAAADLVIGHAQIHAGDRVMLALGAANRDPRQFPDPERLDVTRTPNEHLAFGFDRHFCLGAHLARAEAMTVFVAFAERFPNLTLATDTLTWQANPAYRGVTALPVRFAAA